jgi:hypothetical protein
MAFLVVLFAAIVAAIFSVVYTLYIGYKRRSHVNELRKQGIVSRLFPDTN